MEQSTLAVHIRWLREKLEADPAKRAKYLNVIMKKCDEVAKYTNDLFLHSLVDLDKLKINLDQIDVCKLLKQTIQEIEAGQGDIKTKIENKPVKVMADPDRFAQVIENMINNARKYAKTEIEVSTQIKSDILQILIRDYGPGIPDQDLPFIFDKFYRGTNRGNEQGSGLGLYIVKYIIGQMKGEVRLKNQEPGLLAEITMAIAEEKE